MNNRILHHLKISLKLDYLRLSFPLHGWEPRFNNFKICQMVSKLYTQEKACQHLQDIHHEAEHFAHAFRVVQSRTQNGFRIVCDLRLLKTQSELRRRASQLREANEPTPASNPRSVFLN